MSDLDIIHIIKEHGGLGSVPLARTVYALRQQLRDLEREREEDRAAIRDIRKAAATLVWDDVYAAFKKHAATITRAQGTSHE